MSKATDSANNNVGPTNRIITPGILLFIDQLLIAVGGWVFWLLVSRFVSAFEIGQATSVISLVAVTASLTQLGLEYPLLRRSINHHQLLGGAFVAELLITSFTLPVLFYIIIGIFNSTYWLALIAVMMLTTSSIGFVSRFLILGLSDARSILIIDSIGIVTKFAAGYVLISGGMQTLGILSSFLIQGISVAVISFTIAKRGQILNFPNKQVISQIIKDGLINAPSKFAWTLIFSLSIVLLASFGIDSADIGIFYMALMICSLCSSLAENIAFMVIPVSAVHSRDLSIGGLRLSLSLIAPIISVLIVMPEDVLALIGTEYMKASAHLQILAIGVLPFSIIVNAISALNNLNKRTKILFIGCSQIASFVIAFIFLVPTQGSFGASFAILTAFLSTAILSIFFIEKRAARYIAVSIISISTGIAIGYTLDTFLIHIHPIILSIIISSITLMVTTLLKNTSVRELRYLFQAILRNPK